MAIIQNSPHLEKKKINLEFREKELTISELQLKIKELRRPWYKKLGNLLLAITAITAVGTLIGQIFLSSIRRENLKFEMSKTRDSLMISQKLQNNAEYEYGVLRNKINESNKRLSEISERVISFLNNPGEKNRYDSIHHLIELLGSSFFYLRVHSDKGIKKSVNLAVTSSLPAHLYIVMGDKVKSLDNKEILNIIANKLYAADSPIDKWPAFNLTISAPLKKQNPQAVYMIAVSKYGDVDTKKLRYEEEQLVIE